MGLELEELPPVKESLKPSSLEPTQLALNDVYSPPARGLLYTSGADAGAGVECCWKPAGRPKVHLRYCQEIELPNPPIGLPGARN